MGPRGKSLGWDSRRTASAAWGAIAAAIMACGPTSPRDGDGGETTSSSGGSTTVVEPADEGSGTTIKLDISSETGEGPWPSCIADASCYSFDILVVIDNSSTMLDEQLNVSRNLPRLLDEINHLSDSNGYPLEPNVNLMVTTSDVGHPLCTPFQKPDYEPRAGAPVYTGCNARIERFTSLDSIDPVSIEEACTELCPVDVVPTDPFLHFSALGTNVPGDDVAASLSCIGPQGIDGCHYEAPLEAMLRALDPAACWNDPEQPACREEPEWANVTRGFLRDGVPLVIILVTDGTDCSVAPGGYSFFTDTENDAYWNVDPALGIPQPSPAICFNAGVSCTDADADGTYEACTSTGGEVLHPVERYAAALRQIREEQGKEIVMLGIFGVPEVLAHASNPPFHPTAGGVHDLVYRDWIDAPYPAGDLLPGAWDAGRRAADERFALGDLAPGCIGVDDTGAVIGHALPPVRTREVCESLNSIDAVSGEDQIRCCIESLCDDDFSRAIHCILNLLPPPIID
jgi:hypothetical protein